MNMNKKSSLQTYVGLMGITIILSGACNPQPKQEAEPQVMTQEVQEVEAPKDLISLDEADSLYVNYTKRRAEEIVKMETVDESEPFKPVRFVSFDLETIKEYIAYVEQEAEKGGTKADSLRVYLGNYGQVKGVNERHNTVFILPSAKAEGGYGGIYIGDDGKAKLISNYFQNSSNEDGENKSKASFMPNLNVSLMQSSSLVLNYGNCCPPQNGDF